jgi:hypothetical protein
MPMMLCIFFQPERGEFVAVREILGIFGEASGLKVNYRKTTATLIREQVGLAELVQQILGCVLAQFPIKYLGL